MQAGQLWRQYVISAIANIGIVSTGYCMGWTSPILPKLANITESPLDYVITMDQEAWIGSLLTIGAIFGSFIGGFLASSIGRKWGLLSCSIPLFISWTLLALTSNVAMIYAARIFCGIAISMLFAISPMYCAEIATDDSRGALGSFLLMFNTIGYLLVYVIGPFVDYYTVAYVGIVFTAVFVVFFILMPESPMYYLSKDDVDSATESLCKIRGRSREAVKAEIVKMTTEMKASMEKKATFADIFRGSNFKAFYISAALMFFQQICGINVVLFYMTNIFEAAGSGVDPSISTIIVGAVQVVASAMTPFVVDRLGRRILLLLSSCGTAAGIGLLGIYFTLADNGNAVLTNIGFFPVLSLVLFIVTYCWGLGGLPWAVMSELLPIEVKAVAAPIIITFGSLMAFLTTRYFSVIADAVGMGPTFFIFSIFCILSFFFTLFLVPETKGKSFYDIQVMLSGK